MPTINNATVATGTGLSTAGNGGRKLVRLLNGALISAVRTSTTSWQLHKSLNGGSLPGRNSSQSRKQPTT